MGYNFIVIGGRLHPECKVELVCQVTRLATELELPWSPVNMRLCGEVKRLELPILGDTQERITAPVIPHRPWQQRGADPATVVEHWAPVIHECVQGVILHHPYADWKILWNVEQCHAWAAYTPCNQDAPSSPSDYPMRQTAPADPDTARAMLDETIAALCHDAFWEDTLDFHAPWRRSDVAAAHHILQMMNRCSDALEVVDEFGVWQKGMSAWRNLTEPYTNKPGISPAHPDASELLDG